ncbi:MAG: hypothetical protein AAFS06_23800, partial [Cyanobacteria bacterium J06631_12]
KALKKLEKPFTLSSSSKYKKFGVLRNEIQHLRIPESTDLHRKTAEFIFTIIDPLMHDFWNDSVLNYLSDEIDYLDKFVFSDLYQLGIECYSIPNSLQETADSAKTYVDMQKSVADFMAKNYDDDLSKIEGRTEEVISQISKHVDITKIEAKKALKARIEYLQNDWPDWLWWIF